MNRGRLIDGEESKHELRHILLGMMVVTVTVMFFFVSYQSGPTASLRPVICCLDDLTRQTVLRSEVMWS